MKKVVLKKQSPEITATKFYGIKYSDNSKGFVTRINRITGQDEFGVARPNSIEINHVTPYLDQLIKSLIEFKYIVYSFDTFASLLQWVTTPSLVSGTVVNLESDDETVEVKNTSDEKCYIVKFENPKKYGIIRREDYEKGVYQILSLSEFTRGNMYLGYEESHENIQSFIKDTLLSATKEVFEFENPKEMFGWLAENMK